MNHARTQHARRITRRGPGRLHGARDRRRPVLVLWTAPLSEDVGPVYRALAVRAPDRGLAVVSANTRPATLRTVDTRTGAVVRTWAAPGPLDGHFRSRYVGDLVARKHGVTKVGFASR